MHTNAVFSIDVLSLLVCF